MTFRTMYILALILNFKNEVLVDLLFFYIIKKRLKHFFCEILLKNIYIYKNPEGASWGKMAKKKKHVKISTPWETEV